MVYCSNCGHQLENAVHFCSKCGRAVGVAIDTKTEERNTHCPCCGRLLSAIEVVCPCGYEIQGIKASFTIQEFLQKLDEIDNQKVSKWEQFGRYVNKSVPIKVERKADFIKNFAIPNTKENIIEFMLFALPNIDIEILEKKFRFFGLRTRKS